MFELYRFQYNIKSNISAVRDNKGNIIYNLNQEFDVQAITYGSLIDYTDDRTDPLKGIRFNYNYGDSPQQTIADWRRESLSQLVHTLSFSPAASPIIL